MMCFNHVTWNNFCSFIYTIYLIVQIQLYYWNIFLVYIWFFLSICASHRHSINLEKPSICVCNIYHQVVGLKIWNTHVVWRQGKVEIAYGYTESTDYMGLATTCAI